MVYSIIDDLFIIGFYGQKPQKKLKIEIIVISIMLGAIKLKVWRNEQISSCASEVEGCHREKFPECLRSPDNL